MDKHRYSKYGYGLHVGVRFVDLYLVVPTLVIHVIPHILITVGTRVATSA